MPKNAASNSLINAKIPDLRGFSEPGNGREYVSVMLARYRAPFELTASPLDRCKCAVSWLLWRCSAAVFSLFLEPENSKTSNS